MCVYSMIMDHKYNEWIKRYEWPTIPIPSTNPLPTKEEIDEFRRLLEKAREYDKVNNQKDCEMEDKKKKLMDLAKELGIDNKLKFIED